MAQYTIREISEMFQLPTSTFRYYEDMKILTNIKRNTSGQRIYEDCHVNRLRTICCFKNAGMSISQLKEFFSYESEEAVHIDDILILLNNHKSEVAEQIKNLQESYAHLLKKLHYYGDIKKVLNLINLIHSGRIINSRLLQTILFNFQNSLILILLVSIASPQP